MLRETQNGVANLPRETRRSHSVAPFSLQVAARTGSPIRGIGLPSQPRMELLIRRDRDTCDSKMSAFYQPAALSRQG